MEPQQNFNHFVNLPPENILNIFNFLNSEELPQINSVSSQFNQLAEDHLLWRDKAKDLHINLINPEQAKQEVQSYMRTVNNLVALYFKSVQQGKDSNQTYGNVIDHLEKTFAKAGIAHPRNAAKDLFAVVSNKKENSEVGNSEQLVQALSSSEKRDLYQSSIPDGHLNQCYSDAMAGLPRIWAYGEQHEHGLIEIWPSALEKNSSNTVRNIAQNLHPINVGILFAQAKERLLPYLSLLNEKQLSYVVPLLSPSQFLKAMSLSANRAICLPYATLEQKRIMLEINYTGINEWKDSLEKIKNEECNWDIWYDDQTTNIFNPLNEEHVRTRNSAIAHWSNEMLPKFEHPESALQNPEAIIQQLRSLGTEFRKGETSEELNNEFDQKMIEAENEINQLREEYWTVIRQLATKLTPELIGRLTAKDRFTDQLLSNPVFIPASQVQINQSTLRTLPIEITEDGRTLYRLPDNSVYPIEAFAPNNVQTERLRIWNE